MSAGVGSRSVGFILALLFAVVMGASSAAILLTDYMHPGVVMNDQARRTLTICGIAGFVAALLAWWLQSFASERGTVIRFLYALLAYALCFFAIGGLLEIASNFILSPENQDFSLAGLYSASVGSFYNFALSFLIDFKPAFAGLLLAAALIIGIVGPRSAAQ